MDWYIFFQILLVSIAATSAMTLFSYIISSSFRELYKEPVLLTYIYMKMNLSMSAKSKNTLGWLTHYGVGFLFVLAYHILWTQNLLEISVTHTLLLGVVSGIIGIISWVIIFSATKYQPHIDYQGYYLQLFFAHIIFAVAATATYHISLTISLLANTYVTI